MAERDGKAEKARERRKQFEPMPWAKWKWKDWLAMPAIRHLSFEQRGRFADVWSTTHGTQTPGVMTEDEVRAWAGYTPEEWKANRKLFMGLFNTTRTKGKWRLEDVIIEHRASMEGFKTRQIRAMKAVDSRSGKSRSRSDMATTSQLEVQLGVTQREEVRLETRDTEITDVPRLERQDVGLSASGTGGTAAAPSALLERALRAGCADGTSARTDGAA